MLGIVAGLVLGICVVAAFVFVGSEGTIDAPRISRRRQRRARRRAEAGIADGTRRARARPRPCAWSAGRCRRAARCGLHFKRGGKVRFRVVTDAPVAIAVRGYGIEETLESGQILSFDATRVGQFPLVAAASEIGLATLVISR